MTARKTRVVLLSCPPQQPYLEFMLHFEDGYSKHYHMDEYAQREFRGLSDREIFEEQARRYYEDLGEPCDILELIFL